MILYISVSAVSSLCAAQTTQRPVTSVYNRLLSYTALARNVFSGACNQATLAGQKGFSAGINGDRKFLLAQLSAYQVAAALATTSGSFGVNGDFMGDAAYSNFRFGLAYGRKLGSWLSIGAQFNYHRIQATGYGSAGAVDFETGFIIHLSEHLHTGFHVANPTRSGYNKGDQEKLPAVYTSGLGYQPGEHFLLAGEIQKVEGSPAALTVGLQYLFDKVLLARLGFTSPTGSYYLGAGVQLASFRIEVTASLHPQLGLTPG
ncbi:MAG: hypothetical protein WKF70_04145, partial [Chitinophagaceae bacterium]